MATVLDQPKAAAAKQAKRRSPKTASVRDTELRRFFGEIEVVEATTPLHLQPQRVDIDTAERDDPANCAFSRACQRMYGSSVVLFFGTIAYVDLLDEQGHKKIHRFRLEKPAQEFIRRFDAGEDMGPGGFRLSPPPPAATLSGIAEGAARRAARKREALLKGEAYEPDPRFRSQGMKSPNAKRIRNFRNGSGMVHFPKVEPNQAAA